MRSWICLTASLAMLANPVIPAISRADGPDQGPSRGPYQGPNQGPYQGPDRGTHEGPSQRPPGGVSERPRLGLPQGSEDPRLTGVGLVDLANYEDLRAELERKNPAHLMVLVSQSLFEARPGAVVVDLVGRAKRWKSLEPGEDDGLGIARFEVPVGEDLCDVGEPTLLWERAIVDLRPRLDVSLVDKLVVLEDDTVGFRRVFPVGIGALDRIRRPGRIASLTPATNDGRIDKKLARKRLGGWNRNRPIMSLMLPAYWHKRDGQAVTSRYKTPVALHAWPPDPKHSPFVRSYVSAGCITFRDADLDEMYAFVMGLPDPIPLAIHAAARPDAIHPYPVAEALFWQLKEFDGGKDGVPRYRVSGGLYVTEKVTTAAPDPKSLVDIYGDSEEREVARRTTERFVAAVHRMARAMP